MASCANSKTTDIDTYYAMKCDDIMAELNTLHTEVEAAQNNKEIGRALDTGTSVAVTGASLAGVPYIGGIFSIGKTLINHSKQTRVSSADTAQENIFTLEGIAYEKGCL